MARERFRLGRIMISQTARAALERNGQQEHAFLNRHRAGDWGDGLAAEDWESCEESLRLGYKVLSTYYLTDGEEMWIITNESRTVTEVFLAAEVGFKRY